MLLKVSIPQKEQTVEKLKATVSGTDNFIAKAKRYTGISELTSELLRLFIEKVVVHEKDVKWSKHARQTVEIHYTDIGVVDAPKYRKKRIREAGIAAAIPAFP